jgi:hypothetical protein
MAYLTTSLIPYTTASNNNDTELERMWSGRGLCCNLAAGTEERHENPSPYSQSPGRGFNPRPPIYEAEVLPALL